jgi:hypothetical protein
MNPKDPKARLSAAQGTRKRTDEEWAAAVALLQKRDWQEKAVTVGYRVRVAKIPPASGEAVRIAWAGHDYIVACPASPKSKRLTLLVSPCGSR